MMMMMMMKIRRAAKAALRGVLDPQEWFRSGLPRARACVQDGSAFFTDAWAVDGSKGEARCTSGSHMNVEFASIA